ncbi:MAG: hypothetical protein WDN04_19805 [Rhodospirillales bacterium]
MAAFDGGVDELSGRFGRPRQFLDLAFQHIDPRQQRQDQRILIGRGEAAEIERGVHMELESSRP